MQNEFLASMGGVFIQAQTKPFTSDEYLREQKVILASTAIRYATVCFSPGQGWQGKENLIWYIKYYTSRLLCSNADFCQSLFHHQGSQAKVKDQLTQILRDYIFALASSATCMQRCRQFWSYFSRSIRQQNLTNGMIHRTLNCIIFFRLSLNHTKMYNELMKLIDQIKQSDGRILTL